MRVVLRVEREVPGLAPAGAHITIRATEAEWPVEVVIHYGPDALTLLSRYLPHLALEYPLASAEAAALLARLLADLGPAPQGGPKLVK